MSDQSGNTLIATLGAWWRAAVQWVARLFGGKAGEDATTGADAPAPAPAPSQADSQFFSVAELQCLENFYGLEETPDIGPWRWTGPGCSFALFAPADRSRDQTIVIEALDTQGKVNWHNTFIEVEEDMMLCQYSEADGRHLLTAKLPARPAAKGAFVRYHLQECRMPPAAPDGSRDGRKLGLSLTGLRLIAS